MGGNGKRMDEREWWMKCEGVESGASNGGGG